MGKSITILLLVITITILSYGCGPQRHMYNRCPDKYLYSPQTNYDVQPNLFSANNIAIDTSGLNINPNKIDRLVNEVESCLIANFGYPIVLPVDVVKNAECHSNTFDIPLHRECLVVKIAADWHLSQYELGGSYEQLLPYTNGGTCSDKGLPDPNAVCYYRNAIQDNYTAVSPPACYMLKDAIVRLLTGCANPWYGGDKMSACMNPSTNPLDDGSGP